MKESTLAKITAATTAAKAANALRATIPAFGSVADDWLATRKGNADKTTARVRAKGLRITSMECGACQNPLRCCLSRRKALQSARFPFSPKCVAFYPYCVLIVGVLNPYGSQAVPPRAQLESFHPQNA